MAEQQSNRLIPHRVTYTCDRCDRGHMDYKSDIFLGKKTQYNHTCTLCGYNRAFKKKYPYIDYELTDIPVNSK